MQTLTLAPAATAYATGMAVKFLAGFTNTAACTMNINAIGAKNMFFNGAALTGGEIVAGEMYEISYDGTQFHLLSPRDGGGSCRW